MPVRKLKYDPLRDHLLTREGSRWRTSFEEIEEILGTTLPASAHLHQAFWAREKEPTTHVWKMAWMSAGWEVDSFDLASHVVTFRRMKA